MKTNATCKSTCDKWLNIQAEVVFVTGGWRCNGNM